MRVDQIWKMDHLKEKVTEASLRLLEKAYESRLEAQGGQACVVDILAPAGYHQAQRIAEAFDLDFDEHFSNEDEWERVRREIHDLKRTVPGELHQYFQLPNGLFFSLGYDAQGNFGLILRAEEKEAGKPKEWMN